MLTFSRVSIFFELRVESFLKVPKVIKVLKVLKALLALLALPLP